MQTNQNELKVEIEFPELPLAVYSEIAAHLRQVDGVAAGLYPAAPSNFDYRHSQIGSLWIEYDRTANIVASQARVAQILAYYQNRYGAFRQLDAATSQRCHDT